MAEESEKELKKLTALYDQRPTWLDLTHQKPDAAVFAAYRWSASLSDDELLAKLLDLNCDNFLIVPRAGCINLCTLTGGTARADRCRCSWSPQVRVNKC